MVEEELRSLINVQTKVLITCTHVVWSNYLVIHLQCLILYLFDCLNNWYSFKLNRGYTYKTEPAI